MNDRQDKDVIFNKLKEVGLFAACTDSFLSKLAEHSQIIKIKKNQLLFVHEDHAERFYIIREGWIKLFRETPDGAQTVVDILTKNHMFGEMAIFESNLYPYSAEAVEPSRLISLPLALLKSEIETSPKLAVAMLSSMASHRRHQDQELEHRTLKTAPQRIGCFLLHLAGEDAKGRVTIELPYDKTLIASRLGMQPETFSRALSKLKSDTGTKVRASIIELDDIQKLIDYSCSACSSAFPCSDMEKGC